MNYISVIIIIIIIIKVINSSRSCQARTCREPKLGYRKRLDFFKSMTWETSYFFVFSAKKAASRNAHETCHGINLTLCTLYKFYLCNISFLYNLFLFVLTFEMQCALFARELSLVQGSKCLIFRAVDVSFFLFFLLRRLVREGDSCVQFFVKKLHFFEICIAPYTMAVRKNSRVLFISF